MKIAILSVVPSPYQRDLFRALSDQPGIQLEVYYLEAAAPDSPWPEATLAAWEHILPGKTLGRYRVRCHFNWNLPSFNDVDLVIVNAALTGVTTQTVMRRLIDRGIPWIFWGERLRDRSGFSGSVQSHLVRPLREASAIAAVGQEAATDFRRRLPGGPPITNMPYHCAISAFQMAERPPARHRPIRFLFCGQMIPRKGIDLLLEAFLRIQAVHSNTRLILAGREDNIRERLAPLPCACREAIDLTGFVAPDALPALFAEADVFVLPSRHDGWGVVINQALAAGLPIIASNAVGAAAELITDGKEGFIIPTEDVDALFHAMDALVRKDEVRRTQGLAAARLGTTLHHVAGARKWVALIDRTLGSRHVALAS